jgi:hypothetical protein
LLKWFSKIIVLLKLFQNTKPATVLLIIVLAIIMKWQVLLHPVFPVANKEHFCFTLILSTVHFVLQDVAISYSLLAIGLMITQAFYLNFIVVKYKLFSQNSFIPAFGFLLITSFFPSLNFFSEQLIVNFFVLAGIDKMLGFSHAANARNQIFNAGFLISIPLLFQLSGSFFLIMLLVSLALLRPFQLVEWVVGLIGFFTPIYFFVCLLFLFDKMEVLHHFSLFRINYLLPEFFKGLHLILLLGLFLLIAFGIFALQQSLPRVTIYVRRSWLLMICYCLLALCVIFCSSNTQFQGWILLMPPLSMIISQSFCLEKTKRFSSFTFYFSILLFIFSQLI